MTAHILIVDDDLSIRDAMHEFIKMSGYVSTVASSAEEALDVLTTNSVEVVITDIMLPGMDGLALTDRIKRTADSDVIVMTGYSTEYSYEEAISKGASDFVFKPVRFEELLLRLKRVLNERRLHRILSEYFSYYHTCRTQLSLSKDSPKPRTVEAPDLGKVTAFTFVGGPHHRYGRLAA